LNNTASKYYIVNSKTAMLSPFRAGNKKQNSMSPMPSASQHFNQKQIFCFLFLFFIPVVWRPIPRLDRFCSHLFRLNLVWIRHSRENVEEKNKTWKRRKRKKIISENLFAREKNIMGSQTKQINKSRLFEEENKSTSKIEANREKNVFDLL
jgi:hypothetical protein